MYKGADVHAKASGGEEPIHLAAHNDHKEVVAYLRAKGTDPDGRPGHTEL